MTHFIPLGFEVGKGGEVAIPLAHMAVTGQTQQSGKTTTLEALVSRGHLALPDFTALAFVTKRGERAFRHGVSAGRQIAPYFRDRADWQFVTSIIDATLQEKNKFLRPWIMKICRKTRTLAEVQREVRSALKTAHGINEGVYTQLDAYLDLIIPEIAKVPLVPIELKPGLNVMDVSSYSTPMQMLFIQSAIDFVNAHATQTVVIVPEAWEFIPEGKNSPVKTSAISLVRKGAALGNFIWVDSQDMAGVDKTILRGCAVWLIGVQREANEIRRNLANIPASVARPNAAAVAMLERGQFFACHGREIHRTYVRPAWMPESEAYANALGIAVKNRTQPPEASRNDFVGTANTTLPLYFVEEPLVTNAEAERLRKENEQLRIRVEELEAQVKASEVYAEEIRRQLNAANGFSPKGPGFPTENDVIIGADKLYETFKARLIAEAATDSALLRILAVKQEIDLIVDRKVIEVDGSTVKGRVARLIAEGWFDGEGKTQGATRSELARTGSDVNSGGLSLVVTGLVKDGFLTAERNNLYRSVAGMKVNVIEHDAALR